jgi:integrase
VTPTVRDFVRLLLLTGQRRDEVRLMQWSEIDEAAGTWTIPGARYKTGRAHVVPIAGPVRAVLDARRGASAGPWVFPGTDPAKPYAGTRNAMVQVRRAMPGAAEFTLHDLRRTVRSGLSRLGVAADVAEAVIGHVPAGIVRVYDRHQRVAEKRDALERWAAFILDLTGARGADIVPFARPAG